MRNSKKNQWISILIEANKILIYGMMSNY